MTPTPGPTVGEVVCDCWFHHQRIVSIGADGDTVTLSDGLICSYAHCCDPPDHGPVKYHDMSLLAMPEGWVPTCVRLSA